MQPGIPVHSKLIPKTRTVQRYLKRLRTAVISRLQNIATVPMIDIRAYAQRNELAKQ